MRKDHKMVTRTIRLHLFVLALLLTLPLSDAAIAQTQSSVPAGAATPAPSSLTSSLTSSLPADQTPAGQTPDVQTDAILLVVQPTQPVAVQSAAPVDVEFRITGQRYSTGEPAVFTGLKQVRLRGLSRSTPTDDGPPLIQVVITDIERGGERAPLEGFGSSWLVEDDSDLVLSLSDQVEIEGNRQILVDALASLQENKDAEADDPLKVETQNENGGQAASSADSGGNSGNGSSTDSGYTTPDPVETISDPKINTTETKTGCVPRVDLPLRVAIDQIMDRTFTNGALTEESKCYDSYHTTDKYPLDRDYDSCPIKVNLGGLKATERYKWYYTNHEGSRIDVPEDIAGCIDDTTRTYAITEDHAACTVLVEPGKLLATPRARLIYKTLDGVSHEVMECQPSTTLPAVPLVENTGLCPQPENGNQLSVYTYQLNEAVHQVGVCAPTGTKLVAETVYENCGPPRPDYVLETLFRQVRDITTQDGTETYSSDCRDSNKPEDRTKLIRDYEACKVTADTGNNRALERFRYYYIDENGDRQNEDDCRPDPSITYTYFEDHEACSIEHEAGKAIRQSRLAYQTRDGVKHNVGECGPSASRDPIAMDYNPDLCSNPDGSTARSPYDEQGRYQYTLNGVLQTYGECQDTGNTIEYRADYTSCSMQVDKAAGTVYRQFKIEEMINGRPGDVSRCLTSEDDAGNLTIERDYAACTRSVDLPGRLVMDRYELFYTDSNNTRQLVQSCQHDSNLTYVIFEDHEACSIEHDDGQAIPQARLIYQLRDGERHEVRRCEPSESRNPITMAFNAELCANPDGSTARTPFDEQGRYQYTLDGVLRSYGECQDTGNTIEYRADYGSCGTRVDMAAETIYREYRLEEFINDRQQGYSSCTFAENDPEGRNLPLERDYAACDVIEDTGNNRATERYKLFYIDEAGDKHFIGNCQQDPAIEYAYFEEYEGCGFDHVPGFAIPQSRLIYQTREGVKSEVRECEATESRPRIAMTFNPDLCDNPDGSTAHGSFDEQGINQYRVNNVLQTHGICQDTGRSIEYRADYASCSLDVDKAAGTVYRKFKIEKLIDGNRDHITDCLSSEDDAGNLPIERDYAACSRNVDLAGRLVTDRYELFYNDSTGSRGRVQSCQEDTALTYAIIEDHEACSIEHDDGQAIPQARLIYQLRTGEQHEVRDCEPSESRSAITMAFNAELCSNPDGTAAHTPFDEQGRYQYTLDGVLRSYGECQDTGRTIEYRADYADCSVKVDKATSTAYRQFKIEEMINGRPENATRCLTSEDDAGNLTIERDYAACSPGVDLAGRLVTDRYELFYTDSAGSRNRAQPCQDDSALTYAIFADHEACSIEHDDGQAIARSRLIYQLRDGERHEVRACEPSESRGAITMTFNTDLCENPDRTAPHRPFSEQGIYQYTLDGVLQTHGACQDTGRRIEYRADYDSCGTSVDQPTETVYRQYRLEAVIDGTVTTQTACQSVAGDSRNVSLERDYAACDVEFDYRGMTASRRFQYFYENGNQPKWTWGNCRDDLDQIFALTEDHESCAMEINEVRKKAIPQSRMVYRSDDGAIHEARACQGSETRAEITLTRNTDLCSVRPGNQDGVFEETAIWTYSRGDTVHQVGACAPTGVTYEYRTVYEGCRINVDKRLKVAIRQVKRQTLKDDVLQHSTGCQNSTDPSDRYAFEKNHNACEIDIDIANREATSNFQWVYTGSDGDQNIVTGIAGASSENCVADPDRTYAIYEDHDTCLNFIDYENLKAVPQARLIYRTPDGRDHQVRACEASESIDAVNLVFNTPLCPIEHDLRARKSYENGMYTFTLGGQAYQAGSCSRSDVEYLHMNYYDDCPPIHDLASGYVTRQYRTRISVNGAYQLVSSACTPDPQGSRLPIVSTTDGCNAPRDWDHDIALGISYAKERFYYIDAGSTDRNYLTQCQPSDVTYRHDVEVVGYLHHDAQLADQQRSRVSISTPSGTYVIVESEVLPGTALIPYVKDRTADALPAAPRAGDRTYVGCNAYDRTDRVEVWTRSDGTEYSRIIGDGEPSGPTNACTQVVEAQWPLTRYYTGGIASTSCGGYWHELGGDNNEWRYYGQNTRTAVYEGTRSLTREDGTVISTETREQTITVTGGCRHYNRPPNSSFPNPPSADQINQFLINVGWK